MSRIHSGPNTFPALGRSDADTMSQEPGGGAPVTSDFIRHWVANPGALISGFAQFTINNQTLVAWDDRSAGAIRLVASGSPQGKIGGGSFGAGPDALLSACRLTGDPNTFLPDADAMSGMDLSTWTYMARILFEGAGVGIGRFCGIKHSVLASGIHLAYDYDNDVLGVRAPGLLPGNLTMDPVGGTVQDVAYTVVSDYDGATHRARLYDEDGVLLDTQSDTHSGTTTDGDDVHIHDVGATTPIRIRKYACWNRQLTEAQITAIVANSLTEDPL